MRNFISLFTLAALSTAAVSAQALTAKQTVEKETSVIGADGAVQTVRETVDTIVPGERVIYSLNFENDKADPANDIVLTMPIPAEVQYIEGTADAPQTNVTFSADGGESFSSRQSVMLMDSAGNIRAAGADELTHIRWSVPGPVEAGEGGVLSFAASVK